MKIDRILKLLPDNENEKTIKLFYDLSGIKEKGYLTKKQLLEILKWKSPRPLRHYEANSEKEIREITKVAFATKSDCLKLHILTALSGVNYPSASAILMFYDRKKYPVLDIRVWRQLYKLNLVKVNSRGQGFTIRQCEQYLKIIRDVSKKLNITVRQTEKRLFDYDKNNQPGLLYGKQLKKPK